MLNLKSIYSVVKPYTTYTETLKTIYVLINCFLIIVFITSIKRVDIFDFLIVSILSVILYKTLLIKKIIRSIAINIIVNKEIKNNNIEDINVKQLISKLINDTLVIFDNLNFVNKRVDVSNYYIELNDAWDYYYKSKKNNNIIEINNGLNKSISIVSNIKSKFDFL